MVANHGEASEDLLLTAIDKLEFANRVIEPTETGVPPDVL
jgi:hypothetical protein